MDRQWSADLDERRLDGLEREISETARDYPPVRALVPVVESVPRVMRAFEERLRNRLGRDHLPAGRDDRAVEIAEEAAWIAVRRHHDPFSLELGRRRNTMALPKLTARVCGLTSDPSNDAYRLHHTVARMED